MSNETIFTIGHSTRKIEDFITILLEFKINCLIDVRSLPYSRIAPQYNKPSLETALKKRDIKYMHFEKEFGARQTKQSLLDPKNGKVNFAKVRETDEFKQGVQRLKNGLKIGYKIVLMCSEADPFECHRFSLISYQLVKEGMEVSHILDAGDLLENIKLEERLLEKYRKKLPQTDMFRMVTRDMQLEKAYELRGEDVAFAALQVIQEEPVHS